MSNATEMSISGSDISISLQVTVRNTGEVAGATSVLAFMSSDVSYTDNDNLPMELVFY